MYGYSVPFLVLREMLHKVHLIPLLIDRVVEEGICSWQSSSELLPLHLHPHQLYSFTLPVWKRDFDVTALPLFLTVAKMMGVCSCIPCNVDWVL